MNPYDQRMRDFNVDRVKNSLIPQGLCDRCDGTGNQLYSMYQACEKCKGRGTVTPPGDD